MAPRRSLSQEMRDPEPRQGIDFGRVPSVDLASAPVKVVDAISRRLIDDALATASMPTSRARH